MNIGIVGIGAIGGRVAREVDRGLIPGAQVVVLAAKNLEKFDGFTRELDPNAIRNGTPVAEVAL
jgi:predicted dinucleotide-utilizing enzyme